jgi:hypothetical protein
MPKCQLSLCKKFSAFNGTENLAKKSTKLWQLVQHLKCKVSGKILVKIMVKYKMNATSFLHKIYVYNAGEVNP